MADRDYHTNTTTTGTTGTHTTTPRTDYRDPRTTTTTTTTATRRGGTSWIGAIVAILAMVVIAAWFTGVFEGEETAMMVGDPAVEGEVLEQGTVAGEGATIIAPADGEVQAQPEPVAPAAPAPVQQ